MRVALLMALLFLVILAPAYLAFEWLVRATTVELGKLFAEKQVLYDRHRGLEALRREVSLAQALARSPAVVAWAADEVDTDKRARALVELERFRADFEDNSYFFVIDASGHYYFNDGDNRYAGRRLRYRVDANNPRDGWYFATAAGPDACQPNVDHDDNLAVTKVWINCKVMHGEQMVGMIGTGMDLTGFIQEVVDVRQRGVESIFIDRSGAIQAHRDPTQIDFHSLTKDIKAKKTIFNLLDRPTDREVVSRMLQRVASSDETAELRSGAVLGLVMVDLDHFKAINDTHGHIAGDQVLLELAHRLGACVRTYDVVGRWGGDEFIVLVSVPDAQVLGTVADKLRRAVGDTPIALPDGNEVVATISVGAGLLAHDASIDSIIAQIDTALLDAKRRGRDRVALRA